MTDGGRSVRHPIRGVDQHRGTPARLGDDNTPKPLVGLRGKNLFLHLFEHQFAHVHQFLNTWNEASNVFKLCLMKTKAFLV